MENYLQNYDTFETKIVYDFSVGCGGIGDLTKFFMVLLNLCIKYNIKIHYLKHNLPIEKYIKLINSNLYISNEEIINNTQTLTNLSDIQNLKSNVYYLINPSCFYTSFTYDDIYFPLQTIFYFSDDVILNVSKNFNYNDYISIHLRLGDKYLETDKSFIQCPEDTRTYNEYKLYKFIENNYDKNIYFVCDNKGYKLKLKEKYNKLIITDYDIGHTSFYNTTDLQILNTVSEFYILTNSLKIYVASYSGFSIMASKFKNIILSDI
jgi:hypothetical protein